jgi:hypothetical protein
LVAEFRAAQKGLFKNVDDYRSAKELKIDSYVRYKSYISRMNKQKQISPF